MKTKSKNAKLRPKSGPNMPCSLEGSHAVAKIKDDDETVRHAADKKKGINLKDQM